MNIVVIGSASAEMLFSTPVIPRAGEVQMGTSCKFSPGGRGLKQAIAAARTGGSVVFVGRTGKDIFGTHILQALHADGINTDYLHPDKDWSTGMSCIITDPKGESAIMSSMGANGKLSEKDLTIARKSIEGADILLLQLDVPINVLRLAANMGREAGARVILNPSPAIPVSDELLKSISILTPDTNQAEVLTGINITDERSAELAGRILLERGLSRVIITLRWAGAMVIDNGGAEHVPGFHVQMVNSSLLNDVFNGALAVELASGKNFYEAVLFANAAASLAASGPGTLMSIPHRPEILQFIKSGKRSH
jgi:ribokinase